MGSSRLPGKSLADVAGVPAMTRLIRRLRQCRAVDDIILATSTAPADDALEAWAKHEGVAVFRGSEDDVLARVVGAQREMQSEIVVEVTGDCTLLDPQVVDLGIETFFANDADVVTNARVPSFPMGADVQVFRLRDLEWVADNVGDAAVREHVSLYFYEHPERYRIIHLIAPRVWQSPAQRLQLDYEEDLAFIREVYRRLEPAHGDAFGVTEILGLVARDPQLGAINAGCEEKAPR